MLQRVAQASHQAGYPKIASKARDSLNSPQIDGRKIKGCLDYPRRAKRHFWVAVGAQIKKMNIRSTRTC
jgi:hypothetical protein